MDISLQAHNILKRYFGYDSFRAQQLEIITAVVSGNDVLVLMPTGGGKSLCFQVPAMLMDGTCLVVSPLISLMKDQVDALQAIGINAGYINSSQSAAESGAMWQRYCRGDLKLLYLSPEKMITGFQHLISATTVTMIAIDEAHCISSWGHDFRQEYTQLAIIKQFLPNIPIIALTATADKITRDDIVKQLNLNNPKQFISSFDRPNLSITVRQNLSKKEKNDEIVDFIHSRIRESGIIYCLSRKTTEDLVNLLYDNGIRAACYHAGLSAQMREDVQSAFINDDLKVICATIAFGMGIDKSNVRWVIHYNLPKNIEGYYQEIGRAGRDGLPSDTILYYNYSDAIVLNKFIDDTGGEMLELNRTKLRRMQQFAEAVSCRRKMLLAYFGEVQTSDNCHNCDVCKTPSVNIDGTILAQKALSAIYRTNEKLGIQMIIKILRGSEDAQIVSRGYNQLKTFGVGKDLSQDYWQQYILQMINKGLIEIAYDRWNALVITSYGREVLFGRRTIELVKAHDKKIDEQPKKPHITTISGELFEELRALRLQIARRDNVPPYIIFTDATLNEMANRRPTNEADMLTISGVGEAKLAHYGRDFIYCIKNFVLNSQRKIKGATYLETLQLLQAGLSVEQIAARRGMQLPTVYSHIAQLYQNGETIDIYRYISEYEIQLVREAVGFTRQSDQLKPIYDYLKGAVDYGKIRLALTHLESLKN